MNPANRSLDDLDRLAFRLARVIRDQYPHLATQGFTLIDLEERLLPFRETRREMADGGSEGWERAMLRLLSGERGVIAVESGLQAASQQALQMSSPTLGLVRTWSTSVLMLCASDGQPSAEPTIRVHSAHGCRYCGGRLP